VRLSLLAEVGSLFCLPPHHQLIVLVPRTLSVGQTNGNLLPQPQHRIDSVRLGQCVEQDNIKQLLPVFSVIDDALHGLFVVPTNIKLLRLLLRMIAFVLLFPLALLDFSTLSPLQQPRPTLFAALFPLAQLVIIKQLHPH